MTTLLVAHDERRRHGALAVVLVVLLGAVVAVSALPAEGEAPRGIALDDEEADLVRPDALWVALAMAAPAVLDRLHVALLGLEDHLLRCPVASARWGHSLLATPGQSHLGLRMHERAAEGGGKGGQRKGSTEAVQRAGVHLQPALCNRLVSRNFAGCAGEEGDAGQRG